MGGLYGLRLCKVYSHHDRTGATVPEESIAPVEKSGALKNTMIWR